MLSRLEINGLAIIDKVQIDFGPNYNVVTGETGAGKSIIIKALSIVLGGALHPKDIKKSSESASVACEFELPSEHPVFEMLSELGIPFESAADSSHLIIRRLILRSGRPGCWINDTKVSKRALVQIGQLLVDVCAQHENHRLFNGSEHIHQLDLFIKEQNHFQDLREAFQAMTSTLSEISSHLKEYHQNLRDLELIKYRLEELDSLEPDVDEFERLVDIVSEKKERVGNRDLYIKALAILDGSERGSSISSQIRNLMRVIGKLDDPNVSKFVDRLTDISDVFDDLSFELERTLASQDESMDSFNESTERIELYKSLMYKMRVSSVEELVSEYKSMKKTVEFFDQAGPRLRHLMRLFSKQAESTNDIANKLTKIRIKTARKIEKSLKSEFDQLGLGHSELSLEVFESKGVLRGSFVIPDDLVDDLDIDSFYDGLELVRNIGARGKDVARFLFRSNPGEDAKLLEEVASGGEMSRIVLALKNALAIGANTCVLVFDEIDTGISGKVADLVGRKLKQLGSKFQVICVSHLPQVAAYADRHYCVEKKVSKHSSTCRIYELGQDERDLELARLLSGDAVTGESLNNAKAMVELANSF